MNKHDYIFKCKKCEHILYVNKKELTEKLIHKETCCPDCGEEFYENWIIIGEGNFEEDMSET